MGEIERGMSYVSNLNQGQIKNLFCKIRQRGIANIKPSHVTSYETRAKGSRS